MNHSGLLPADSTMRSTNMPEISRFLPAGLEHYGTETEIVLTLLPFIFYIPRITSFLKGFPTSKKGKVIGYKPQLLVFHIIISLSIIGRYMGRLAVETAPTSTKSDLTLGLIEAVSSWNLIQGTPFKSAIWRSSFQTAIPLYTMSVIQAHTTGSPAWYSSSAAFMFWFVLIRWAFLGSLALKFYPEVPTEAVVHLISFPLALCWANWTTAIPFYFIMLGLVTRFNQWVGKQVPHR